MSTSLSVRHLRPRSSLGYVLVINWLSRALLGWLVALPLIEAVSGSGIHSLPQADRALFEAGGLWLLELGFREMHALLAGLRASLWLALAALVLRTPVSALLYSASVDPKAALPLAFRRALALFPRFLGLSALEACGRGLCVALTLLLAYGLETLVPRAKNEMFADWPTLAAALVCAFLLSTLAVFLECSRAFSAASPQQRLREVFASAAHATRTRALEWAGSGALYVGTLALLLASSGRLVELIDVGRPGAQRVLAVWLLHQGVLLAACWVQSAWVRRVLSLTQAGPDSPRALR